MTDPALPTAAPDASGPTPPGDPRRVSASDAFRRLLVEHRLSLLVSTYDANSVFLLRANERGVNVHFVRFSRAMGIAATRARLAVGSANRVHEFYNMPVMIPELPAPSLQDAVYDACYAARGEYVTGDIQIHEMAFAGNELWFVNTRFSCLCTLSHKHSFEPRWRPPWIRALSADDRCHLNGLAVEEGRVAYCTAFATSDEPEGWRPTKSTSGLIVEVPSGRIVTQGLAMPHSPRVHGGHLWVLNSGHGTIAVVDRGNGQVRDVCQMAGFTRGLDFHRNLAFVGLSRVRQSNVFGGTPLTTRIPEEERFCGIQVVDVTTGGIVGAVKFEGGVNEIFAVQVLPSMTFPHIVDPQDPLVDTSFALSDAAIRDLRPSAVVGQGATAAQGVLGAS